jgi:hypothetical protein
MAGKNAASLSCKVVTVTHNVFDWLQRSHYDLRLLIDEVGTFFT